MKKQSRVTLPFALLVAAVLVIGPSSASIVRGEQTSQAAGGGGAMHAAAGTYSATLPLGSGFTFRALATMHADGTITSQDITDFAAGSVAGADGPHYNTLAVGSWKHTRGRSFVATLIFFRSAAAGAGEVDSIGRLTFAGSFDEGFQTGTLEATVEVFPCVPASIGCPNPALLPPPAVPPLGTFTMLRIMPQ